jgi:hypothetical protein
MKLVAFQVADGAPRSGVLLDGDKVVDLRAASMERRGELPAIFVSVLSIIEGGSNALDRVRETIQGIEQIAPDAVLERSRLKSWAPRWWISGSGTVGNGCGLEHLRFLKSGDVVEPEVAGYRGLT